MLNLGGFREELEDLLLLEIRYSN